jgi:hypothetical protein
VENALATQDQTKPVIHDSLMKSFSSAEFLSLAQFHRPNVAIGQQSFGAAARAGTRSIQDIPSRLLCVEHVTFPFTNSFF